MFAAVADLLQLAYQNSGKSLLTVLAVWTLHRMLRLITSRRATSARLTALKSTLKTRLATEAQFVDTLPAVPPSVAASVLRAGAAELASLIRNGTVSAEQTMTAYARHALKVNAQIGCLTHTNFRSAIDAARAADARVKVARGELSGAAAAVAALAADAPLLGVPLSVKDCLHVAGLDTTNGISRYVGKPRHVDEQSVLVTTLSAAGAIPFVKTNVPQTMLSFECVNPVFGTTQNPHCAGRIPGGSSGGEAALLASHGSCLGVGTDIGGSVRIPAAYSGCIGLKPTHRRLSKKGAMSSTPGQQSIHGVVGPMARNVDDLILFFQSVLAADSPMFNADCDVVPLPFRAAMLRGDDLAPAAATKGGKAEPRKLVFGYYTDAGELVPTSPACARPVTEAVAALRAAGYECREFKAPAEISETMHVAYGLLSSDGAKTLASSIVDEPVEKIIATLLLLTSTPWLRHTLCFLLRHVLRQPRAASLFESLGNKSVTDVWRLHKEVDDMKSAFADAWRDQGIDLLITPSMTLPALEHGVTAEVTFAVFHTMLFNVLDLPAGVLTTSAVDATRDEWTSDDGASKPTSNESCLLHQRVRKLYDVKAQAGLPVGVQVVGAPFAEERVLAGMRIIEQVVDFKPSIVCDEQLVANGLTGHD
jgi:amidase